MHSMVRINNTNIMHTNILFVYTINYIKMIMDVKLQDICTTDYCEAFEPINDLSDLTDYLRAQSIKLNQ